MSKKIEIEIDELLFEMINKALKKRNQNIGSDISINHYVKLLAEKSFKQLLVEHYDDIFKELTNDIDAIDREKFLITLLNASLILLPNILNSFIIIFSFLVVFY